MLFLLAFSILGLAAAVPQHFAPFPNRTCTATNYLQIPTVVAACTEITLDNIHMPSNITLDLTKLQANSIVTFAGKTVSYFLLPSFISYTQTCLQTFGFTNSSTFNPISVKGVHITLRSAPGAIIDGNGQAYWDGIGGNGLSKLF